MNMTELELLEGLTFGPPTNQNNENIDYFIQNFWGEKNQGFEVLLRNLKHGQSSCVKYLQDFIRESAASEDLHAKQLTKLAKHAANANTMGTFSPMFEIFKDMSEKLSSCHMDVVSKLHDVMKGLSKYFDEQKAKPKQIKDDLNSTSDAVHQMDHVTGAVQKGKEKFHQLCMEVERLKKSNASSKEIEKAECKSKKASEDYKHLVEKYANVRKDYEHKMTESAKKFQEIEIAHLTHMKGVLESYVFAYENSNVLISQVHQEFRKQIAENSIASLLKRYSESKGTGTEKPGEISFEECDVSSVPASTEPVQANGVNGDEQTHVPNKTTRRPITLPFRRKKPRKTAKEAQNGSKENDKEQDSIGSMEKDSSPKIDEEGFSIRPESPKEAQNSWWGEDSSGGSDSDEDEYTMKKIRVEIKPKEASTLPSNENNLNTLNAITKNLTLSSPGVLVGKRLTRQRSDRSLTTSPSLLDRFRNDSFTSSERCETPPLDGSSHFFSDSPAPAGVVGGARVLPPVTQAPSSPTWSVASHSNPPVPARRRSTKANLSKLSVSRRLQPEVNVNRFSTAFVDMDEYVIDSQEENPTKRNPGDLDSEKDPSPRPRSDRVLSPISDLPPRRTDSISSLHRAPPNGSCSSEIKLRSTSETTLAAFSESSNPNNPSNFNNEKQNSSSSPEINKKSSADELLDLFGNNLATSNPPSGFADFSKKSSVEKANRAGQMQQSSSCASLDVLFSIAPPDQGKGERTFSKSRYLSNATLNSQHSTPVLRPTNLTLENKAPLASSESLSSLSSLGGTPVESFAVSRGPSPLTLSSGDPVPIAVAFTETVNAMFKGLDGERCIAKIIGEIQLSFPAGIIRAFTSNPNPVVLSFQIKGFSNPLTFAPSLPFLFTDASQKEASERTFWFDMTSLVGHLRKMTEASPNSPFYNVAVLSYELTSHAGLSLVPLRLKSSWHRDKNYTDVTIDYSYNSSVASTPLKSLQFVVPIDGGVTNEQSRPPATWNASQNRLLWKLNNFVSTKSPSGTLQSKLSLSSGPTTSTTFAVQFSSEGGTLTGSDFELVGSGYRLSLVKKRFSSGKYLLNGS